MIQKRTSKADAVLAIIEDMIGEREEHLTCVAYVNGREHGWWLYGFGDGPAVAFAENRNSDDIVVYAAKEAFAASF